MVRLIGESGATRALRDEITVAAGSAAKVLITGETGAGKDLVAHSIHEQSARRHGPIAAVNCAGLPDSLAESELFGHTRGSFTDAHRERAGVFEMASKGTVFLDEVGEMSPRIQAALLRFLETGEIQKVGADRPHTRVDVRVVAATNRNLGAEIDAGRFRLDLYYRLNVLRIHVPPLRERREDIPALLDYYLDHYGTHHRVPSSRLSSEVLDWLAAYDWPGNVRQLKNVVERLILRCPGRRIDTSDLPQDLRKPVESRSDRPKSRSIEQALLSRMLEEGESFWPVVFVPFKRRDLTRAALQTIVLQGLARAEGNYRLLVRLFNMPDTDYRRFLSFLRQYHCLTPIRRVGRIFPAFSADRRPPATAAACGHAAAL